MQGEDKKLKLKYKKIKDAQQTSGAVKQDRRWVQSLQNVEDAAGAKLPRTSPKTSPRTYWIAG